ncbi:MAG: helicase HerA-like domain-containing protein, partial [Faecalibacillus sp.]
DDAGYLMDDLKDLRAMLAYVGEHRNDFTMKYGNVSSASIGAIQRALLKLEDEGGNQFFGLPSFEITDWIRTDEHGKGYINILNSIKLIQSPTLYSTFLLWMLSDLYEQLPEVGDLDKPRMVFFFDEAHLLFDDCPSALIQKIEQIVKLIRSKGIGIYFVTQNPSDIPDEVLAQLSNRVLHALRAFTPAEQKAVKVAAQTFRQNPSFKVENVIGELKVGEALVSFLDEEGAPGIVQRACILPPQSKMGAGDKKVIQQQIISCEFELKYRKTIDRISAFENIENINREKEIDKKQEKENTKKKKNEEKEQEKKTKQKTDIARKTINSATSSMSRSISTSISRSLTGGKSTSPEKMIQRAATNALSTFLRESGKSISRGLFGTKK